MKYIDLRSDTVTQPTPAMRQAMFTAVVGDDVYDEDSTITKLQEMAAEKVGKEAALFVPSGTMGNEIAVMTHTQHGDEIIIDESYHIVQHEVGAAAVLAGVMIRTIKSEKGIMSPESVKRAIREDNLHYPPTGLICLENPNSLGIVSPLRNMAQISKLAVENKIPVHLDGARLFNAALVLGVDVKEITQYADSVMFCLSKGLCAPVGSILAGSKGFIAKAKKQRKLLGGGMRQAGFLAAAGIVALEEMVDRLVEDHTNARLLAQEISSLNDVSINISDVHINMVFVKFNDLKLDLKVLVQKLKDAAILVNDAESGVIRFVTNKDVTTSDIQYVVKVLKNLLSSN